MTPSPSITAARRSDRGGISWVTVVILLAIASAVYLTIIWAPIYVVHYEAKQAVRDYMNQAIKNPDDAVLVENLCAKLKTLDRVKVVGEDGLERVLPAIDLRPEDVSWERDTSSSPPVVRVKFEYTREVRYPYLSERPREWVGRVDLENDISMPDWGPSR